ncbi:MAG: hypothetical protein JSU07_05430 [Bacteroidetes bacterium]|nr:hypothetical protein [Bacteroidota bacterium]
MECKKYREVIISKMLFDDFNSIDKAVIAHNCDSCKQFVEIITQNLKTLEQKKQLLPDEYLSSKIYYHIEKKINQKNYNYSFSNQLITAGLVVLIALTIGFGVLNLLNDNTLSKTSAEIINNEAQSDNNLTENLILTLNE